MMDNIKVLSRQCDVSSFYNQASLVLNLSNPRSFVETFGLTALEAMSAGLPVIVPTVGGIAEMVEDGVNGYKIDVKNLDVIADHIRLLLTDKIIYLSMATSAQSVAKHYDYSAMVNAIAEELR